MSTFWPYVSFILGAIFALALQWISYRLAFKKDKRKEYWIRKLNSYQDFYHHPSQLVDLIDMESKIQGDVFWQSIFAARKAAYDARFYDLSNIELANEMIEITQELIHMNGQRPPGGVDSFRQRINEIQSKFYMAEKDLGKKSSN